MKITIQIFVQIQVTNTKLFVLIPIIAFVIGVKVTKVTLTAYATYIGPYSDTYNNIDVWMYFRRKWNDPRLAYELKSGENNADDYIVVRDIADTKMWTPDTFFSQEMNEDMTPLNFIRIFSNGDVLMSEK